MSNLPSTLGGCQVLLELVEKQLKILSKTQYALIDRIALLNEGRVSIETLPERRARGVRKSPKGNPPEEG